VSKIVLRLLRLPEADPGVEPVGGSDAEPTGQPGADPVPQHVVDLADEPLGTPRSGEPTPTPLARWSASVAAAHEPCLVLDAHGRVLSLSVSGASLLGCSDVGVIGRPLLSVVDVVDFETGASGPDYAVRVAPLAVLVEGTGLMRSLLRVRLDDGSVRTVDAAAAPIHDVHGSLVGSVTFLASLGR